MFFNTTTARFYRAAASPMLRAGVFWICFSGIKAQTLQIQVIPEAGKGGSAIVKIASPPGKEPVALQWEFVLPVGIVLDAPGARPEVASVQSKKALGCRVLANRQGKDQTCRCILAGGAAPIPDGDVIAIRYITTRNTNPGRYELHLKNAIGVSSDNKKIVLKEAQTEIIVAK